MKSISTEIQHVTVFRQGALIRRTGRVSPDKAPVTDISIGGLPLALDDSSLRAGFTGSGTGKSSVRDVRVVLDVPDDDFGDTDADKQELKDAQRHVQRLRRELNELQNALQRSSEISWPSRPVPEDPAGQNPSATGGRKDFAEYLDGRYTGLAEQSSEVQTNLKDAEEKLSLLIDREDRRTTDRRNRLNELRKAVVVSFENGLSADESPEVFIEYLVPGARWVPTYGLQFDGAFKESVLSSKALIVQGSGEDWRGVDLTLSTAVPHRMYDLPELRSRRIGRKVRQKPHTGWKPAPIGSEKLLNEFKRFAEEWNVSHLMPAGDDGVYGRMAEDDYEADEYDEPEREMTKSSIDEESIGADIDYSEEMAAPPEPPRASMKKMRRSEAVIGRMSAASEIAVPSMGMNIPAPVPGASLRQKPGAPSADSSPDTMTDYDLLRLDTPESFGGTTLTMSSRKTRYMEMIDGLPQEDRSTLSEKLADLESTGYGADFTEPPANCRFPGPVDGYDFSFSADSPVSIDSDSRYHTVSLTTRSMPSKIRYVSVPRLDSNVFGMARLINQDQSPLLPGPVDIRVESDFICSGEVDVIPAGGEAELGLGVEGGIKVARNVRFREETSGITGANLSLHHEIRIEVVNNLQRTVNLEIRERIPINRADQDKSDEKVKIEISSVSPAWESFDQEPDDIEGGYRWRMDFQAGERKEFEVNYDIRIPSNREIVDGNNREAE